MQNARDSSDEKADTMSTTEQAPRDRADYPEDRQEQGWCCRECGAMAWYNMSPELRRLLAPGPKDAS